MSVYFTKLKSLWDELGIMDVSPSYTCGAAKLHEEIINRNKITQSFMGLNDALDPA